MCVKFFIKKTRKVSSTFIKPHIYMAGASNTVQTSTDLPSGRFPENRDEACSYCTKDDSKVLSVEFHKMNKETMRAISFAI